MISSTAAGRAERGQNAMQVDAVHVMLNQERQGSGSGPRSDKGKGGKGGKGKSKKGGKGKEKNDKPASNFEGECKYCQKKGHKKAECRQMKEDLAAGKCDKHGKPTGVHCSQRQARRSLPRNRAMHRLWQARSRCSRWSRCISRIPWAVSTQKLGSST